MTGLMFFSVTSFVMAVVAALRLPKAHASLTGYLASLALGVFLGIAGAVVFWRLVGFLALRADRRSTKKLSIGAVVVFIFGFTLAGLVWVVGVLFASIWTTTLVLRHIS